MRRERDGNEWTELPISGFKGRIPAWPFTKGSTRERALWKIMWRKPQAIMWKRNGQELEVGLYVRRFAEAEAPGSQVNLSTLVRQMGDSLGLTEPGLRSNRWKIVDDPEEAEDDASTSTGAAGARQRFGVVKGGRGS